MADHDLEISAPGGMGREAAPRSVTAFFDTQDAADHARLDLIQAGVPERDVRVAGGQAAAAEPAHPHSFWESLKEFFVPDEDRTMYAEGLRRGGIAVSVQTDSAAYNRVLEILDRDGAVDMEERAAGWRDEGWAAPGGAEPLGEGEMAYTPAGGATGGFAASRADQPLFEGPLDTAAIEPGSVVADPVGDDRAAAGASSTAAIATDASPQRDRSHGRTRVRSYVAGDL